MCTVLVQRHCALAYVAGSYLTLLHSSECISGSSTLQVLSCCTTPYSICWDPIHVACICEPVNMDCWDQWSAVCAVKGCARQWLQHLTTTEVFVATCRCVPVFVVDIVYLDFRKAFDTAFHKIRIEKLLKCGLDEETVRWIEKSESLGWVW